MQSSVYFFIFVLNVVLLYVYQIFLIKYVSIEMVIDA